MAFIHSEWISSEDCSNGCHLENELRQLPDSSEFIADIESPKKELVAANGKKKGGIILAEQREEGKVSTLNVHVWSRKRGERVPQVL